MNKITSMLLFIIIILIAGFCAYYKREAAPRDNTKQLRDSLKEQNKIILLSAYKQQKLEEKVAATQKELQASEEAEIKMKAYHDSHIAHLQQAHQSEIDSLFKLFYPDSSKRAIVITHEQAKDCDSLNSILHNQIAIHQGIERYQGEELAELKNVQLPAYQKKDSLHTQIENNLTNQLKRAKARRFTIGPSLNLGIDGTMRPGISVGYALIKF